MKFDEDVYDFAQVSSLIIDSQIFVVYNISTGIVESQLH